MRFEWMNHERKVDTCQNNTGAQITTIFTLEKIKIKLALFLSKKKKKPTF